MRLLLLQPKMVLLLLLLLPLCCCCSTINWDARPQVILPGTMHAMLGWWSCAVQLEIRTRSSTKRAVDLYMLEVRQHPPSAGGAW